MMRRTEAVVGVAVTVAAIARTRRTLGAGRLSLRITAIAVMRGRRAVAIVVYIAVYVQCMVL